MASGDLQDFKDRIAELLEDTAHTYYTDAKIEIGLRWALSEYHKQNPTADYAIKDLDSAPATTLASDDWKNVQVGSAGYTALIRSISRVETINLEPDVTDNLKMMAESYLASFYGADLTLQAARAEDDLEMEAAKAANITARDAALDIDNVAMEDQKDGHLTAREAARYAADLARDAALDADNVSMEAARQANLLARDAALDTDNIAMEDLKDDHLTAREAAKYAADLARDAALDTDNIAMEELKDGHLTARDAAKYAADIARDAALDTDNVAMEELKAGHAITLQAARAEDNLELQAVKTDGSNYKLMAQAFKQAFDLGLTNLKRRSLPRANPDKRNWHDRWEGQY